MKTIFYDRECIATALYNKIYVNYYLINQSILTRYTVSMSDCYENGFEYIENIHTNIIEYYKYVSHDIWTTYNFLSVKHFVKNTFINSDDINKIQFQTIKVQDKNWTVSEFHSMLLPLNLNWKTISKLQRIIFSNIDSEKNNFLFRHITLVAVHLTKNNNYVGENYLKFVKSSLTWNENMLKEFNRLVSISGTYKPLIDDESIIDSIRNSNITNVSTIIQEVIPDDLYNKLSSWISQNIEPYYERDDYEEHMKQFAYTNCVHGTKYIYEFISTAYKSFLPPRKLSNLLEFVECEKMSNNLFVNPSK